VSKRILLIDSDEGFAQGLSSAMEARGFVPTLATDSEQGISLAKEESPDLIVVCVEAQPTNGYMVCTRLKKDEQLKSIPVILTSSQATPDSFEKHKKLKTRAEEYLIKPFAPQAMLEKASRLLGVELPAEAGGEEEIVAVEDEPLGLGDLVEGEDEPISLSAADVAEARSPLNEEALIEDVEEVVELESEPGQDEELEMFDKAFDSLGSVGAPVTSPTSRFAETPPVAERPARRTPPTELSAPEDDAVLESLGPDPQAAGSSPEIEKLKNELAALKEDAAKREANAKTLQQRADALAATAKKFERELGEAKKSAGEELKVRISKLEKELTAARREVESVTGEKDALAEERDQLQRQLEEAQAAAGQNEDRAVKAYAKIKNEEKMREKARKALSIALQLLEDSPSDGDEDGKKVSAKA
jgi:CheY-like chemotaxis protein